LSAKLKKIALNDKKTN